MFFDGIWKTGTSQYAYFFQIFHVFARRSHLKKNMHKNCFIIIAVVEHGASAVALL